MDFSVVLQANQIHSYERQKSYLFLETEFDKEGLITAQDRFHKEFL